MQVLRGTADAPVAICAAVSSNFEKEGLMSTEAPGVTAPLLRVFISYKEKDETARARIHRRDLFWV